MYKQYPGNDFSKWGASNIGPVTESTVQISGRSQRWTVDDCRNHLNLPLSAIHPLQLCLKESSVKFCHRADNWQANISKNTLVWPKKHQNSLFIIKNPRKTSKHRNSQWLEPPIFLHSLAQWISYIYTWSYFLEID